jgi:Secretion system C-terminal sorting domain
MKPLYPFKTTLLLLVSISAAFFVNAQPTLEFSSASGPGSNGATIASQVITFQDNTNNPSGNTFVPYTTPTITATFSLSNQQYSVPAAWIPSQAVVLFGGTVNLRSEAIAAFSLFTTLDGVGGASSNDFTAAGSPVTPGTGISGSNNYAVEIFNSAMGLYVSHVSTTGRYYTAELTITFSTPVTNPVIHVAGMGATAGADGSLGITSEMDLQTPGVTLSRLSGSSELTVNSTQILNNATHPAATTGSGAASGSILATGSAISSLVFKIYLRADGNATTWTSATQHTGDAFLVGVSSLITNIVLPVGLLDFTATAQPDHTTELQWATATEENSGFFDVEYSTDQTSWQSIGSVQAAGNSNTQKNYSFIHNSPASGNNYYRLKEVDLDGNGTYSKVCVVTFSEASRLSFYPNPVKDRVTITYAGSAQESVSVLTIGGRELQRNDHFNSGGSLDLSGYPTGIYLLAIKNSSGTTEVLKVLKN